MEAFKVEWNCDDGGIENVLYYCGDPKTLGVTNFNKS